jgi:hypothetical protein
MTTIMPLTMTPEMNELRMNYFLKDPIVHEERVKYVNATLKNIAVNHSEYFLYFFNKQDDIIALTKWIDRKEKGEPYTDKDMLGVYALNSCHIKYFALAIFKELALGIFDQDQFYEDCGVPKNARRQRRQPKDILKCELKQ